MKLQTFKKYERECCSNLHFYIIFYFSIFHGQESIKKDCSSISPGIDEPAGFYSLQNIIP